MFCHGPVIRRLSGGGKGMTSILRTDSGRRANRKRSRSCPDPVQDDPLDAVLHVESGRLWAEWMHEAEEFGCAERDAEGAWIPGTPEPWYDPSWIGVEHTRKAVRTRILY